MDGCTGGWSEKFFIWSSESLAGREEALYLFAVVFKSYQDRLTHGAFAIDLD